MALFLGFDTHHREAARIMEGVGDNSIYLPYSIASETVTVLTYKHSKKQAEAFIDFVKSDVRIIFLNDDLVSELDFYKTVRRRISFADASLIYLARTRGVSVVSFDKQLLGEISK